MITIVDYGTGNLRSIQKSLERFYPKVEITKELALIKKASGIILPGVGAFGDAIEEIQEMGLFNFLKASIGKIPTLGICLGMQLMFSTSEESLNTDGLDIISGNVLKLNNMNSVRIPHTGWNRLIPVSKPIVTGYAYFNHSYYCIPNDINVINSYVLHGKYIPSIIKKGNILGTQFHPEKSKEAGNTIFNYFLSIVKSKN